MRALVLTALAASLWTSPAAAQFWGGPGGGASNAAPRIADRIRTERPAAAPSRSFTGDLRQIREDIRTAVKAGQLTRREERQLRRQTAYVAMLQNRYRRGGLSGSEGAELATRLQLLRDDLTAKRSAQRD